MFSNPHSLDAIMVLANTLAQQFKSEESQKYAWQAFELTALNGKTAETAATEMRTSVGAVYVARCRVLKLLKKESQRLMSEFEVDAADASSFTSLSEGAS